MDDFILVRKTYIAVYFFRIGDQYLKGNSVDSSHGRRSLKKKTQGKTILKSTYKDHEDYLQDNQVEVCLPLVFCRGG